MCFAIPETAPSGEDDDHDQVAKRSHINKSQVAKAMFGPDLQLAHMN